MNLRLGLNKNMKGKSINAFSVVLEPAIWNFEHFRTCIWRRVAENALLYKKQVDVIFHAKIDTKNASIDCFV